MGGRGAGLGGAGGSTMTQAGVQNMNDGGVISSVTTAVGNKYSNVQELVRSLERGGYNILNNQANEYGGTLLVTDTYGSDGVAYEITLNATYTSSDPASATRSGVHIRRVDKYEEGEW